MVAGGDELYRRLHELDGRSKAQYEEWQTANDWARTPAERQEARQLRDVYERGYNEFLTELYDRQDDRHHHWMDIRRERDQGRNRRGEYGREPADDLFARLQRRNEAARIAETEYDRIVDHATGPGDLPTVERRREVSDRAELAFQTELTDTQDARHEHWTRTRLEVEGYRQEQEREVIDRIEPSPAFQRLARKAREREEQERREGPERGRGSR